MESSLRLSVESLDKLEHAAEKFVQFIQNQPCRFVAFSGEMGAGKTTFIRTLLKKMEVEDEGSSPTFALINVHQSRSNGRIYHCDFYRLKTPLEAYDLGVEEIFSEDSWCFVEWPEKLGNLLPEKFVEVKMTDQNGCRIIEARV